MLTTNARMSMLAAGFVGFYGAAVPATADVYQERAARVQAFSWTGLYIGGNGGYAWSNGQNVHISESLDFPGLPPVPTFAANFGSLSPSGGFGGVQVGANLQMGAVVLGFEADGQWADIVGNSSATAEYVFLGIPTGIPVTTTTSTTVDKFGTLRPRLGLAWDRTLIYATGGLAWGRVGHVMMFDISGIGTAVDHVSGTQVGYAVGGGIEHAFTPRVSIKVEYQYI